MRNRTINDRVCKRFVFGMVLFVLPILAFSAGTRIQKYYDRKDYDRIIDIIESNRINMIEGIGDYRICARSAFLFGLYQESCNFYQNVLLMDDNYLNEQDLINYAFALMKLGKSDQILSRSCFLDENELIPELTLLKNIIATRDSYTRKKDSLVSVSDLSILFLPQYGLDYFENRFYYSFSRFPELPDGNLSADKKIINDRRSELAGIKSGSVSSAGRDLPREELTRYLKGSGRIATMNVTGNGNNYFATIVGSKGEPEQIVVQGNQFPDFPFNSTNYACAMPHYSRSDQRLYFCSDMPGGFGGWDIYYCEFSNGKWQWPVNMGHNVNGPFDELFPSRYGDMLLFSSEAREGLGDFDNYCYSLTTGSLLNLWPFNTSGTDLSFRIIQDNPLKAIGVNGQKANYYTSDHSLTDILNQHGENRVVSPETNPHPASNVVVQNVGKDVSPPVRTDFLPGDLSDTDKSSARNLKAGEVSLGNLVYGLNDAGLNSTHFEALESVAKTIRQNDYSNIVIRSFPDRPGSEKNKGYLSYQRATGVVQFLKSKFQDAENKFFFTIAEGECFPNKNRDANKTSGSVEIYAIQEGLPFHLVYAYKNMEEETASSVAGIFNNNIEAFRELNLHAPGNRTNSKNIYIGIQCIHVVSPGETTFQISQKYNCQVDQLLKANHKANQNLVVAEKLIIPLPFSNLKNLN